MKIMVRIAILAAAVGLGVTACHTGGGYTLGGTVTGLKGSGLVLQNNSGNNVNPKTNGAFVFSSAIDQGGPYSVTIRSQPTNPAQTCAVYNGSGTIGTADVTNIVVTCTEPGRYAYVANQGSNTISAYSIDAATGTLKEIAGSPFASMGTTPVSAVVDPNGTYLYVANHDSNDVSVFAIDNSTGALTSAGNPIAAGSGPFAVLVDPADQFLYVANMGDNTVSVFVIDGGTGLATPIGGSPYTVGNQPTSLKTDPGGNYLYVTNYADGQVAAFSIEAGAGSLTAVAGSPFGAGAGALSIAIDPTGTFAYVANEIAATISAYSITPSSGALGALSDSPLSTGSTGSTPESVAVDPAGKFLFAANVTGQNEVSSYSITPSSGELGRVSTVGAGTFPVNAVIDPSGQFAYFANESSNNIGVYSIDATTGALSAVPGSPFAAGSRPRWIAID